MVKRNPNLAKLQAGYLFPEINKRKKAFLEQYPTAKLISLGIGDTTEPLSPFITRGLIEEAERLGQKEGYSGYGPEQGHAKLRKALAATLYQNKIEPDEVFISDGAKCDIGRLQILFGSAVTIAVQDPSYPAYVDTGVILGQTGNFDTQQQQYKNIVYMRCTAENNFFPDLDQTPRSDIIYFCSPNNPTGAAATYQQLEKLVAFARQNRSIIVYDAAYSFFITEPGYPRSIYEITGADEVAIEIGSFSKITGFTGVRLAWSVVPKKLAFEDGSSLHQDWNRINSTFFNGASNIAQAGGLAALQPEGMQEMSHLLNFYMENARILRTAVEEIGYTVYGGINAPYIWADFPGFSSWDTFERILEEAHIVCTPGSGFGPGGEGFVRFSAFGHRQHIQEAAHRLKQLSIHSMSH